MVDEKDIEYGKIFHRQLDVIKEQEKLLDHKDREIDELYRKWVEDTQQWLMLNKWKEDGDG